MEKISTDARRLAMRLGLGDLIRATNCHGYACCCTCDDCVERERLVQERQQPEAERLEQNEPIIPLQPWDVRPSRRNAA